MDITLRLNSGEVITLGEPTAPEVLAKYETLLRVASAHAESRQTIPDNARIIFTVGEELGLWEVLAMPDVHDVDDGRKY